MPAPIEVMDVLGNVRLVKHTWSDGSWECPFCSYGYNPKYGPCKGKAAGYHTDCGAGEHCQNPACFANPHYPVERARQELAAHERRKAEEAARIRIHEDAMRRIEADRKARDAKLAAIRAEADSKGACIRCALKDAPYRVKFVKHRGTCPLDKSRR